MKEQVHELKSLLKQSCRITGFTGAGISTESGISDYRSKGGIWDKFQPVYFDEFLRDENKRLLYWQRKAEQWDKISQARPNKGHVFFKNLYDKKKLIGLITQNIDGLHEKSGIPGEIIVNLHGTTLEIICLECRRIIPASVIYADLNLEQGAPLCPECRGLLKPNTISFGQNLNHEDLEKADHLSRTCDLMIVMGSTLVVQPAASFPFLAKQNGAKLVLINLSETPLDHDADLLFQMKIKDFIDLISTV